MDNRRTLVTALVLALMAGAAARAQDAASAGPLPAGAKVYVAPMAEGFETYLKSALTKKNVPLVVVEDKTQAQFEISGHAESQKASTAKKLILGNWHSREQASIRIADLSSGDVVFAYSVNKSSSAHGKQSTAEACAKHIKKKIDSGK